MTEIEEIERKIKSLAETYDVRIRKDENLPYALLYYPQYPPLVPIISEIEEITAFYESQVGQKLVSLVPTLMQESVEMFNEKYSNKIMEIDRRIRDEEFARIKSGIEELKRINEKIH